MAATPTTPPTTPPAMAPACDEEPEEEEEEEPVLAGEPEPVEVLEASVREAGNVDWPVVEGLMVVAPPVAEDSAPPAWRGKKRHGEIFTS